VYEADKSLKAGSNAFLPKPIRTETLFEKPFADQMLAFLEKYLVDELSEWLEGEMMDER